MWKRTGRFGVSDEEHPFELIHCRRKSTNCKILTTKQRKEFEQFLKLEMQKFELLSNQGLTDLVQHRIVIEAGAKPVRIRPYRRSPAISAELNRPVTELKEKGYIRVLAEARVNGNYPRIGSI